MITSILDAAAVDVTVNDRFLVVRLKDGREIAAPLAWFPALRAASAADRANWRLIGDGEGIHWPTLDEDLAVAALLRAR